MIRSWTVKILQKKYYIERTVTGQGLSEIAEAFNLRNDGKTDFAAVHIQSTR